MLTETSGILLPSILIETQRHAPLHSMVVLDFYTRWKPCVVIYLFSATQDILFDLVVHVLTPD
jgi:hypothetical protein